MIKRGLVCTWLVLTLTVPTLSQHSIYLIKQQTCHTTQFQIIITQNSLSFWSQCIPSVSQQHNYTIQTNDSKCKHDRHGSHSSSVNCLLQFYFEIHYSFRSTSFLFPNMTRVVIRIANFDLTHLCIDLTCLHKYNCWFSNFILVFIVASNFCSSSVSRGKGPGIC